MRATEGELKGEVNVIPSAHVAGSQMSSAAPAAAHRTVTMFRRRFGTCMPYAENSMRRYGEIRARPARRMLPTRSPVETRRRCEGHVIDG
jgi:hypothetical protein